MTNPQVLSDEQIDTVSLAQWGPHHGAPLAAHRAFARAIESAALEAVAAQEPFGYFRALPCGWEQCAETDDGAVALYERPSPTQPPAQAEREALLQAARVQALEDAANRCRAVAEGFGGLAAGPFCTDFGKHTHQSMAAGALNCAADIDNMKGQQ